MINQLITLLRRFIDDYSIPDPYSAEFMDTSTFNKNFSFLIEFCDDEEDQDYGLLDLSLISHCNERPNISVLLTRDESEDFINFFQDVAQEASLKERLEGSSVVLLIEIETHYGDIAQPITATNLSVLDSEIGCYHKAPLTGIIQRMFSFYALLLTYHYDVILDMLLNSLDLTEDKKEELLKTTFDLHFPPVGRGYTHIPINTEIPEDLNYLETTVEGIAYTQEVKETVRTLKNVNVVASLESLMKL